MKAEWTETTFGEAFALNPERKLQRGMEAPHAAMEDVSAFSRSLSTPNRKLYAGSGARFRNGDTLLARITPCLENGKTAFVNCLAEQEVAHGSTEFIVVSGRPGISDNLFAYYTTISPNFRTHAIGQMSGTSGRQRVPTDAAARYELKLPPLPEQRAIARILSSLDDKIELNRRMNATLEALAQTLFRAWFVDFEPVKAKAAGLQPVAMDAQTAALFPSEFEASTCGPIPKGWKVQSLDSIATFLNGLALQKHRPASDEEGLPAIKIAQLRSGSASGDEKASPRIGSAYTVEDGDVLFSWSGSLEVTVWCGGRGALNQHLFKVSSAQFPKWFYLLWTLKHLPHFRDIAADKATTMGHIQRRHLTEAKVLVPGEKLLKRMTEVLEPLLERQINNKLEARTLADIRDSLLPRLISGQIRVPDAEQVLASSHAHAAQ